MPSKTAALARDLNLICLPPKLFSLLLLLLADRSAWSISGQHHVLHHVLNIPSTTGMPLALRSFAIDRMKPLMLVAA